MNVSYQWIRDLVPTDLTPAAMAEKLTHAGCVVEELHPIGEDTQLVAEVTTNRPDWLCHHGIAREIAAMTGTALCLPAVELDEQGPPIADCATVRVDAPDLCPRYTARVIQGVTVRPSPPWLQQRLEAVGLRPINNIVDITNLVLYEMNQPLHAFDLDRLAGGTVVARRAKAGETLVALDGSLCRLTPEMLVIADAERPMAVAGVMGGRESEVAERTVNVLLESAWFDPSQVRRTSRALKLASDSSYRFERGVDPGAVAEASARAAQLIVALAGGTLATGILDTNPTLAQPWLVTMRHARCTRILGFETPPDEVERVFQGLGLTVHAHTAEAITVTVPTCRQDLTREIDLIEEVVRCIGFDRVPDGVHLRAHPGHPPAAVSAARGARATLTALGYFECVTDPFLREEWLTGYTDKEAQPIRVLNPVNHERPLMRTALTPGLLEVRRTNRDEQDVRLFEIAHAYFGGESRQERTHLAILDDRGTEAVRGALETILRRLGRPAVITIAPAPDAPIFAPGSAGHVLADGVRIGVLGVVDERRVAMHDLTLAPAVLEIDFGAVAAMPGGVRRFVPLPRVPGVRRDINLVVPETVTWAAMEAAITSHAEGVERYQFESVYRGKGVPAGKKAVAFSVLYRAADRSLTDEDANGMRDRLVAHLTTALPEASLR